MESPAKSGTRKLARGITTLRANMLKIRSSTISPQTDANWGELFGAKAVNTEENDVEHSGDSDKSARNINLRPESASMTLPDNDIDSHRGLKPSEY